MQEMACSFKYQDFYERYLVMKSMLLSNENELQIKFNLILYNKRESTELVDAAESTYLRFRFIQNLSKATT